MSYNRIVFTPKSVSTGLNLLVDSLRATGTPVLKTKLSRSSYRQLGTDLVINWGNSQAVVEPILNTRGCVELCSNKKSFLEYLNGAWFSNIPVFYCSRPATTTHNFNSGNLYCRTIVSGSEGRGIVVAHCIDEVVDAQLYTVEVEYTREVRLHIFNGKVISFQQKKKKSSERRTQDNEGEVNLEVRNSNTGWVFARDGVTIPDRAVEVALRCCSILGVDLCAVDMLLGYGDPVVLEVNTAPGMEGTTVEHYRDAIIELINQQ